MERVENMVIGDLVRNDLSRIAKRGTVEGRTYVAFILLKLYTK